MSTFVSSILIALIRKLIFILTGKYGFLCMFLVFTSFCNNLESYATGEKVITAYRIQVALKLFPRIAATDLQLKSKLGRDHSINLIIFYKNNMEAARRFANTLAHSVGKIGNLPIKYSISNSLEDIAKKEQLPVALFVSELVSEATLQNIIKFGRNYHRLIFSPYEGDVERGVCAGIHISNKITPYFNLKALASAKLSLNHGLLRVSNLYE